jgi:hypothetical protein
MPVRHSVGTCSACVEHLPNKCPVLLLRPAAFLDQLQQLLPTGLAVNDGGGGQGDPTVVDLFEIYFGGLNATRALGKRFFYGTQTHSGSTLK